MEKAKPTPTDSLLAPRTPLGDEACSNMDTFYNSNDDKSHTSTVALTHAGHRGGLEEQKGPSSKWLVNFQYTAPVLVGAWVVIWGARGHLSAVDLAAWATLMGGGMLCSKWLVHKRQKRLCIAAERLVRLAGVRFGQKHEVTERARAARNELQEGARGDADFHTRMEASLRYTEELLLNSVSPPLA